MIESPLLRLPGELRTHIYRYVFGGETFICSERSAAIAKETQRRKVNCLRISYQIWSEARSLPFHLNTFDFSGVASIRKLVRLLGKTRQLAIRSITLRLLICRNGILRWVDDEEEDEFDTGDIASIDELHKASNILFRVNQCPLCQTA